MSELFVSTQQHLNEITGFTELVKYYEQNKDKDWQEWLEYSEIFKKPGKQGIVGLFKCKDNDKKIVFKLSQYINYLIQHEYIVMKGLNEISTFCPHFCKSIGMIYCQVEADRKVENPFKIKGKHPIEKEVLLTEYVDNSHKFYNYIRSEKAPEDVLYSTIKQVLMAICIAQREKKFTHYDLHSYNIMMRKCNKNVVFLYVLDEDNQFCVPTYGYYPKIIDFGFSYISDMDNDYCWPSLGHTDVGFMSDRFDKIADPKLFLVTVSKEIKDKRGTKRSKKLRNVVKNIFNPLSIEWDSGWDTMDDRGASDYILDLLENHNTKSVLFDDYDHYCVDLIQSLIILPLEPQKFEDIHLSYIAFIDQFNKIEKEIGNPFYNLYILKGIVDVVREVRSDYLCKNTRHKAVKYFRECVYERINYVADYCQPKDIHFEKMICSLLCLSKNMEGILYTVMKKRMREKEKEYNKMPIQEVEQIYGAIDINIPDDYVFSSNSIIYVMDCVSKTCKRLNTNISSESLKELNDIHSFSRGPYLYSLYKDDKK